MPNHLFVNGCSHTAGSEIEGSGIGEGNYNRQNCFGAQVAKQLGWAYTNIAYPGGSNDYIKRSTIMWILDNQEKAKDTHFFINWTGSDRTEYFFDEEDTNAYNFISYAPDKKVAHLHPQHYPDWAPKKWKGNLENLSRHLFLNHTQWDINRYLNIIELQTLFKAYGYSYTFRNSFQCCENRPRYQQYIDKIDKNNFLYFDDSSQSFYEHCFQKGFDTKGQRYWHHKLPAHTYWAKTLLESSFALYS